jgi:hypothetical protein
MTVSGGRMVRSDLLIEDRIVKNNSAPVAGGAD